MKQFAKTLSIGAASLFLGLVYTTPAGYIPTNTNVTVVTVAQSMTNNYTPSLLGSNNGSLVSSGIITSWIFGKIVQGITG